MSTDTVTIACKLPNGLQLRLHRFEDAHEPVMGGGTRTFKKAIQVGEPVIVRGNATPYGQTPRSEMVGGYALTPGVPADFWEEWVNQNSDHDAVKKRLIFAQEKHADAQAEAKEFKATRSGLEPIVPDKDPRVPKPSSPFLSPIEKNKEGPD